MNSYLQLIEVIVTVITAVSIIGIVFICNEITSEVIAGSVFLLVLLISVFFADKIVTYISTESRFVGRLVWYGGFAYLDLVAVILVSKLHLIAEVSPTKVSGMIVIAFWSLGIVQIARLIDRYSIDILGEFYSLYIPFVNMAVMSLLVVTAIKQIYARGQKNGGG